MDESIHQIGQRLKGLRDVLDIPAEEVAELCEIPLEHYLKIEAGEADPSVYRLSRISKRYGIALDVLLFGEEPRMGSYFLTRKGKGLSQQRPNAYKYQSLAASFRGRQTDPFYVEIDPLPEGKTFKQNSHGGQEFDYVLEGRLEVTIGEKTLTLDEGDSVYLDASHPHSMRALGGKRVKFLCIVI
ncbi:MAG: helix-turn-helix transcriptional regulator [Prevotella sp.]|nr:helix-turn-helix transcriptional regulator [Prevotella sp.]